MTRRILCVSLSALLASVATAQSKTAVRQAPAPVPAAQRFESNAAPPARFVDADRKSKLAAAFPEIDRIFRDWADQGPVPGVAYGIIIDGELVHANAFGLRDAGAKTPTSVNSVFRIASMTKSFTALAIMKLRDEGRLSLEDPVAKYVPELATLCYPTKDSPVLTVRHLLSHSEGFPEDNPWGDRQLAISPATMSLWMKAGIPFSNAPGVAFEYSNYGFAILGQIVSRVSGMPYRAYVDSNILKPLGMTSTTWEEVSVPKERVAKGYKRDGNRWVEEVPLADGAFGAMGGLYSSVPDLAKYVTFYLSAYPPRDDADPGPVRRASLRLMQTPVSPYRASARRERVDGPLLLFAGGYGFALNITQTCRFGQSVSHSGGLPGFGSQMRWLPEYGVGVVALANRTYAAPGRAVGDALEALARTGALKPRVPQPSKALLDVRTVVNRLYAAWDDKALTSVAADNLFLDRTLDVRRKEFVELREQHGACRADGSADTIDAKNALRGQWTLACERGEVRMSVTLAPTAQPTIQYLEATSILPLGPKLGTLAMALASRIAPQAAPNVSDLLAPGVDAGAVLRAIAAAGAWGYCRVGDVLHGGGDAETTVRFECDNGPLDVSLSLDADSGKLKTATVTPAADQICVPAGGH